MLRTVKNCFLALACLLLATGGLRAQTAEEAARELLATMKVEEQYKQMSSAMAAQLRPALESVSTRVPEEKRARYVEISKRIIDSLSAADPKDMIEATVKTYAKYYSAEELQGLNKFYGTELGKKMMLTMPRLTAELMSVSMQWNQAQTGRVMQELMQEFPELNMPGSAPAPAAGGEHQHQ